MDIFLELIKGFGGIAGLAALTWRLVDEFVAYLRISVKADGPKHGWASVLTTVENKGSRSKSITNSLLLVGPEEEDPVETANKIASEAGLGICLRYTNDLAYIDVTEPLYKHERALIPIPFYYQENISIGDELLTYRASIDTSKLARNVPYSVRFFVFESGRLHRSTHDSFINGGD
jgi:hypothetical protein